MCPGYDQVLILLTFGKNSNKSDWTVWLQHLSKLESMKCGTQLKTSHHVHILPSMVILHVFCLITPLISISTFDLDMPGNFLRIIITSDFSIIKATLPLYKERIKTLFATCVFVLDFEMYFPCKNVFRKFSLIHISYIYWMWNDEIDWTTSVTNFDFLRQCCEKVEKNWEMWTEFPHNWMTDTFDSLKLWVVIKLIYFLQMRNETNLKVVGEIVKTILKINLFMVAWF